MLKKSKSEFFNFIFINLCKFVFFIFINQSVNSLSLLYNHINLILNFTDYQDCYIIT